MQKRRFAFISFRGDLVNFDAFPEHCVDPSSLPIDAHDEKKKRNFLTDFPLRMIEGLLLRHRWSHFGLQKRIGKDEKMTFRFLQRIRSFDCILWPFFDEYSANFQHFQGQNWSFSTYFLPFSYTLTIIWKLFEISKQYHAYFCRFLLWISDHLFHFPNIFKVKIRLFLCIFYFFKNSMLTFVDFCFEFSID